MKRMQNKTLKRTQDTPGRISKRGAKAAGNNIKVTYTLDELDDLAGFIAAEANHAEDKKLKKKLESLYDKISDIENQYH